MDVFEAKKLAEEEYAKTVSPGLVSGNNKYIVVSDGKRDALIVTDMNTAMNCGCKWIFQGYIINGEKVVKLLDA